MKTEFLSGMVTAFAIIGLWQDWLGLDGYIAWVSEHWVGLPWWVWLIPLLGAPALTIVGRYNKPLHANTKLGSDTTEPGQQS